MAIDRRHAVGVVPGEHPADRVFETDSAAANRRSDSSCAGSSTTAGHIVGARFDFGHRFGECQAEMVDDDVEHLPDRVPLAGRDVEDAGRRAVGHHEIHEREEIVHVEEIADGLRAEATLAGLQPRVEGRDRADREARTGDVGEPQRHERQAGHREIVLAGLLGDAVAGERPRRRIDRDRHASGRP